MTELLIPSLLILICAWFAIDAHFSHRRELRSWLEVIRTQRPSLLQLEEYPSEKSVALILCLLIFYIPYFYAFWKIRFFLLWAIAVIAFISSRRPNLHFAKLLAMDPARVKAPRDDASFSHQLVCELEAKARVRGLLLISQDQIYFCPDQLLASDLSPFQGPVENGFQPEWLPAFVPNRIQRWLGYRPHTRFRYQLPDREVICSIPVSLDLLQSRFKQIAEQTNPHPSTQPAI